MILIVSCEKQSELYDLEQVIKVLKNDGLNFVFVDVGSYTGEKMDPTKSLYVDIIQVKNNQIIPYYKLTYIKKVCSVIKVSILMHLIAVRYDARILLHGIPLIFFRILSANFFRKYNTFCYVRSTVAINPHNTRWITKLIRLFFVTFNADFTFCINDATKNYIKKNKLNKDKGHIENIGSIYSYSIYELGVACGVGESIDYLGIKRVCFLTSAFKWHGNESAHNEQYKLILDLMRLILKSNSESSNKIRLCLKIHPRDDVSMYSDLVNSVGIELISDECMYPRNDIIFLSIISTLSLELSMAGCISKYVANENLLSMYEQWYLENNVVPYRIETLRIEDFISESHSNIYFQKNAIPPQKKLANKILESI